MVAGGVEMSRKTLLNMSLQEMFDSFCPNDIRFGVKFIRLQPKYQKFNTLDD